MKQGMGLLEVLLYKQPVQDNQMLLKVVSVFLSLSLLYVFLDLCFFYMWSMFLIEWQNVLYFKQTTEICRLYDLESISSSIMKV